MTNKRAFEHAFSNFSIASPFGEPGPVGTFNCFANAQNSLTSRWTPVPMIRINTSIR